MMKKQDNTVRCLSCDYRICQAQEAISFLERGTGHSQKCVWDYFFNCPRCTYQSNLGKYVRFFKWAVDLARDLDLKSCEDACKVGDAARDVAHADVDAADAADVNDADESNNSDDDNNDNADNDHGASESDELSHAREQLRKLLDLVKFEQGYVIEQAVGHDFFYIKRVNDHDRFYPQVLVFSDVIYIYDSLELNKWRYKAVKRAVQRIIRLGIGTRKTNETKRRNESLIIECVERSRKRDGVSYYVIRGERVRPVAARMAREVNDAEEDPQIIHVEISGDRNYIHAEVSVSWNYEISLYFENEYGKDSPECLDLRCYYNPKKPFPKKGLQAFMAFENELEWGKKFNRANICRFIFTTLEKAYTADSIQ